MIFPRAVVLALLVALPSTGAFSPVANNIRTVSVKRTVSSRRTTATRLSNDDLLTEPKSRVERIPLIGADDSVLGLDSVVVEGTLFGQEITTGEVDLGKEIFDWSADAVDPVSSSSVEDTTASAAPMDVMTNLQSSSNIGLTDEERTGVISVLAASQEAVQAAEASLPQEVKEQLDFSTSMGGSNGTFTVAPVAPNVVDLLPDIKPASEIVGEPVTSTPNLVAPSVKKILKFAIPAIGVWLCGPLLSLIDTSAVGLLSGTTQQAALNPAVAVTDYAALLIAFMYTGTTNLVAAAQESDRAVEGKPTTMRTLVGAMQLSTYVGLGLGSILFVFARPLLNAIIGNGDISPAVFTAAMKYVRIRAIGMPAAAIIGSAQAACLGMQDIKSPLYVLLAAAVVNFFGDMCFVGNAHPLIGGAAGAAWATVFSQYAAVALFVRWLTHKPETANNPKVVNLSKAILEMTGKPTSKGKSRRQSLRDSLSSFKVRSTKTQKSSSAGVKTVSMPWQRKNEKKVKIVTKDDSFSVRGFLKGRFSAVDMLKLPSKEIQQDFKEFVVPVTTTQVGRVSGYIAMSHVIASSLGTVSMAAQQVIVSLFYCLCPIADSLSLTAQSFLPSISEKKRSVNRAAVLRQTTRNFFKAGGVFGAAMVGAVLSIPLLSGFFTADPAVVGLVNSVSPLLLGFFALHGVLCSAEGLLLGQKDLGFLGKMYAGYFVAVPYFMLRLKRAALSGSSVVDLTSVWKVFLGYQIFRFAAWVGRVAMLQRRTDAQAADLDDESLAFIAP